VTPRCRRPPAVWKKSHIRSQLSRPRRPSCVSVCFGNVRRTPVTCSSLEPRNQLRSFSWDFLRIINIRSRELRVKVKQCYCHKPKIATRHESYVPPFVGRRVSPVQLDLIAAMLQTRLDRRDIHRMQLWAGQSAAFASRASAGDFVRRAWGQAEVFLP
jgi:hypothetical protein